MAVLLSKDTWKREQLLHGKSCTRNGVCSYGAYLETVYIALLKRLRLASGKAVGEINTHASQSCNKQTISRIHDDTYSSERIICTDYNLLLTVK